jgi:hypothetical protein
MSQGTPVPSKRRQKGAGSMVIGNYVIGQEVFPDETKDPKWQTYIRRDEDASSMNNTTYGSHKQ